MSGGADTLKWPTLKLKFSWISSPSLAYSPQQSIQSVSGTVLVITQDVQYVVQLGPLSESLRWYFKLGLL